MEKYQEQSYEVYKEKFEVTEWRKGTVYKTKSLGCDWYDMELVDNNKPKETNLIFANAEVDFMCIRTR